MADTTFVNGTTLSDADWFNDLNRLHYTILSDPADAAAVRVNLAVAALAGATFTGLLNQAAGADIASATTVDLTAATGNTVNITGTTPTSALTMNAGQQMWLIPTGAWPLTQNATTNNINGGASYTCVAGDRVFAVKDNAGIVRTNVIKADGTSVGATTLTSITASLGANVALNNTALYFDGPSVAQGTSGTWFVTGIVTCVDPTSTAFFVILWDGTTVISSARVDTAAGYYAGISLSGVITSPVGNLRLSVRDISNTTGAIAYNATGQAKDSTITAVRIA